MTFYNCICEPEKTVYVNDQKIRADIYVKFKSCNYAEYNKSWNNQFIIEISISHPVDSTKKYNLKAGNLATIEVEPNDKFKTLIREKATEYATFESINNAINYINNSFNKNNIFSKIIVDPMSDSILLNKIKNQNIEIKDLNNKLSMSENNLKALKEKYNQLYIKTNNYKNTISSLNNEILDKNKIIHEFSNSIFYKLYKLLNHKS